MAEVEDARNSITFLQQQPQVDETSIGILGTSFGGAIAIYAAALDERIKCVGTNVSVGNGAKWLRSLRNNREWRTLLEEVDEDRKRQVLTGNSRMVSLTYILPDEASKARREELLKRDPTACSELPLETIQAVIEFKPEEVVHRISPRPLLFTVAGRDILTPVEFTRELHDRAGEPKRFVVIPGAEHYETYSPPYVQRIIDEHYRWFEQYLSPQQC